MQFEQGLLTIAANNAAVAAKLRQIVPDLLQKLKPLQPAEVTGIQVKVQVSNPAPVLPRHHAQLGPKGRLEINHLLDALADSPLKSALQKLASSAKTNSKD